jgi:hypothetical protein
VSSPVNADLFTGKHVIVPALVDTVTDRRAPQFHGLATVVRPLEDMICLDFGLIERSSANNSSYSGGMDGYSHSQETVSVAHWRYGGGG